MGVINQVFGEGSGLNSLQMACRGIVIFIVALVLIRISGRRSFGMRTPLDNVVLILLGAILSRAVVGASPFLPVIITCMAIVLFHRFLALILVKRRTFDRIVEGDKIILFKNGNFIKENLDRALVSE